MVKGYMTYEGTVLRLGGVSHAYPIHPKPIQLKDAPKPFQTANRTNYQEAKKGNPSEMTSKSSNQNLLGSLAILEWASTTQTHKRIPKVHCIWMNLFQHKHDELLDVFV